MAEVFPVTCLGVCLILSGDNSTRNRCTVQYSEGSLKNGKITIPVG